MLHSAATTGAESHSRAFHVCRRVVHAVAFELLEADGVQPAVVAARCRDDRSAGETRSVILTPDRRYLFTTNGGDNSVSSFSVGEGAKLALVDVKRTGNIVTRRSGTAKSLCKAPSWRTLFVLHAFGPDHVRPMSVDADG